MSQNFKLILQQHIFREWQSHDIDWFRSSINLLHVYMLILFQHFEFSLPTKVEVCLIDILDLAG